MFQSTRVIAACCTVVAGLVVTFGAEAASADPVKQISRTPSLPAACLDPGAGPASTDIEPQVAVDPRDPQHQAAVWTVFQPGKFAPRAERVAVTRDGGRSWQLSLLPGVDSCTGNPAYSVSGGHNPTLSFGPDGRLYVQSQSGKPGAPGFGAESLWVTSTKDDGKTWMPTVSPMQSSETFGIPDQARLTADPVHPGTAYLMSQVSDPSRYQTSNTFTGKAYFTRTDDAGRTWSPPALAYAPVGAALRAPNGNSVVRLADGSLLDVFSEVNGSGTLLTQAKTSYPDRIYAIRSVDGGRSWSVPVQVAGEVAEYPAEPLVTDPPGANHWGVDTYIPAAQLAPDGRTVYVAWSAHANDGSAHSTFHVARSDDSGRTWTQTAQPTDSNAVFMPNLAVAGDGSVGVTWFDLSAEHAGESTWPADVRFASSRDRGATWSSRVLTGTMNLLTEQPRLGPNAFFDSFGEGSVFLADYNGITGLPHGFAAVFAVTQPLATDGATDIDYASMSDGAP